MFCFKDNRDNRDNFLFQENIDISQRQSLSKKKIVSIVSIVFKITLTDCLEKKRKQEEKEIVLKKQKATAAMEIVHRLLWLLI